MPAAASSRRVKVVATALALQLGASLAVADVLQRADAPAPPDTSATARRAAPSPVDLALARLDAVAAVLDARGRAVLARDRKAFLATVDPRRKAFRAQQAALFDALEGVPLTSWSYAVDPDDVQRPDRRLDARYGTWWAPQVTLRHALEGIDTEPAESTQHLTFVQRGERWYVASDSDFAGKGQLTDRALWDFGPVVAVRGRRSLVLGHPESRAEMQRLAADVDAAVPRVSAVWGDDWSRRVAVLVPSGQTELGKIVRTGGDLTPIAALAMSGPVNGGTEQGGDRVLVNPPNIARLGDLGRRVVLAHEVTHVASRSATGPLVPHWMAEGLADHVGYLDQGVPVGVAAGEVREDLLAGRLPRALPRDEAFDGDNADLGVAYEQGWLAVEHLIERYGRDRFLALYRDLGERRGTDEELALRQALEDVLGTTPARLVEGWRASIRRTLS